MAKEPDYDAMAETADEPMGALALAGEDDTGDDTDGGDLDEEFRVHAKDAGLSDAQAKALKLAIDRCYELRGQGEPDADASEDADEAAE